MYFTPLIWVNREYFKENLWGGHVGVRLKNTNMVANTRRSLARLCIISAMVDLVLRYFRGIKLFNVHIISFYLHHQRDS